MEADQASVLPILLQEEGTGHHQEEYLRLLERYEELEGLLGEESAYALRETEERVSTEKHRRRLKDYKPLPTQKKYLDAINNPEAFICAIFSGNQFGKSHTHVYDLLCESFGYQPHDGTKRPKTDYDIALILRDYDQHARKVLYQNVLWFLPKDCVKVDRTQKGAPRVITPKDPYTDEWGKPIFIFTHDQDWDRLEGGTWQRIAADEPFPRSHFMALVRGLQKTGGKFSLTATPLSEPWIYNDVYLKAHTNGGPEKSFFVFTAFPDENLKSNGGYLEDERVESFRNFMTPEEKEARVHGRFMHLIGRVYPEFDTRVHVLPNDGSRDPYPLAECADALVIDPHDRLPWAISFVKVTPANDYVIYDEWPHEPFEELTQSRFNYDFYSELIRSYPRAVWNLMDPNFGRRTSISTGLTTAEEMTMRTGRGFLTDIDDTLTTGHNAVKQRLSYNTNLPIDTYNQPRLFVRESCRNHIQCFSNYIWDDWRGRAGMGKAPKDKPQEKFKHFMDCVRYLCMYPIVFVNPKSVFQASFHRAPTHHERHTKESTLYGQNEVSGIVEKVQRGLRQARRR
jgi:hypothetical protein